MLFRRLKKADDDGLNSAVYFIGEHLTTERIQNLTKCLTKDETYVKVKKRKAWVQHLKSNTRPNQSTEEHNNKSKCDTVFQFFKGCLAYDRLHKQIATHCAPATKQNGV